MTSEYNGYFNANELYDINLEKLRMANVDNYSKILEIEDFTSVSDPKMVNTDMDKAIEKVTRVVAIHEAGDWVDDCYVLMAKAQYLKQDYETATETLEYFEEDFNPTNPFGKNFMKKKISNKEKAKIKEAEREEQRKEKEKEKEKIADERKEVKKAKEEERKEVEKKREQEKKDRAKASKDRKKNKARTKRPADTPKIVKDSTKTSPVISAPVVNANTPVNKDEALKDDMKDAEKEKASPPKPKEDKTAYSEGLVWLAKSYIKTERFSDAEFLLNRIQESGVLKEEVSALVAPAQAELMIQQNRFDEAIPLLQSAIETAPSKSLKGRYAFIIGQILEKDKDYAGSSQYFEQAKKYSRDFKMKFMAELAMSKSNIFSGKKSSIEVAKDFEDMLKEEKYNDYKDQIYFAMGEIERKEKNSAQAITYFKSSVANNQKDETLKAEAYLNIAELTFDTENYVDAKLYYDSTSLIMPKTDERYFKIKSLASSLSGIAANIQKIEKYDSLLTMSLLPKEKLNEIAVNRLKAEKESGVKMSIESENQSKLLNVTRANNANSSFFAYNLVSVEAGKSDFRKNWGNRKLEDDWRTSNETEIVIDDVKDEGKKEEDVIDLSESEFKRLLADVPFSPMLKDKYNQELRKAMFDLGKQYRDNLQNYPKSIATLEALNTRFPDHVDKAEALYYLAVDYIDIGEPAKAKLVQNEILANFPDTKFAKIIGDPAYGEALLAEKNRLDTYYDQTYDLFKKEQYEKVQSRIKSATENFGTTNKLIAKFALLNAMCLGHTSGKDAYIKGLQEVITRYPKTPEETKAKEIMRFLGGDKAAFENINIEEVDNIYQLEDDKRHYVAVIIFSDSDSIMQDAKVSISEYNKEFHSLEYLQLGDSGVSQTEQTQEILIRSFDNRSKAMAYYTEVMKDKEKFLPSSIVDSYICAITQANHRKMLASRTHKEYQLWFENKYLNPDGKK